MYQDRNVRDTINHIGVREIVDMNDSIRFGPNIVMSTDGVNKRHKFAYREPTISKKNEFAVFGREKTSHIINAFDEKRSLKSRRVLFTNTKRNKKDSKRIFTVHMVKRNINLLVFKFFTISEVTTDSELIIPIMIGVMSLR